MRGRLRRPCDEEEGPEEEDVNHVVEEIGGEGGRVRAIWAVRRTAKGQMSISY